MPFGKIFIVFVDVSCVKWPRSDRTQMFLRSGGGPSASFHGDPAMTRTALILLAASATLVPLPRSAHAAGVTLVKDGKPLATIVVARDALKADPELKPEQLSAPRSAAVKIAAAARDLQTYIAKISGAKLPISGDDKEPDGCIILVGRSELTKPFDKKIPDGLTSARAEEGLLILCQGKRLVLAGNDQPIYCGTEYAVAEFLHRLGVRWFMPGEFGDCVPKLKTIEFPEGELVQTPSFKIRNWWGSMPATNLVAEYRWKIRNKMNPDKQFRGDAGGQFRPLLAPGRPGKD